MQKTLILTFELLPKIDPRQKWSILEKAEYNLKNRTLSCAGDGNKIIAKYVHKNWDKRSGSGGCPENSFWNTSLEGMRFVKIVAEYTNALLTSPEADFNGNFQWWNGESHWFLGPKNKQVVLTCLPSQEIVLISMDIDSNTDSDIQRRAFLEIRRTIQSRLKLTQTAQRLISAFLVDPKNSGRIRRFKNKMFLEIAQT